MTFEPCEIRKCITVSITDDLTVEEVEESFVVRLDIDPMINSMITVEPVPAVVTIRDNDGRLSRNVLTMKNGLLLFHDYSVLLCKNKIFNTYSICSNKRRSVYFEVWRFFVGGVYNSH